MKEILNLVLLDHADIKSDDLRFIILHLFVQVIKTN